jgi:hypothetical protein
MAYTLYTDKPEDFICEVSVKNASLKNAFSRIIVESDDLTLMFKGKIEDGKCIVPIKKLKGLLEENTKGNIHLEVVVDDTYFKPWTDNFVVEEHTSIKVKVNEQSSKSSNKPILEVKNVPENKSKNTKKISIPTKDLIYICERIGITKNNINIKKSEFKKVIKEYFKNTPEFRNGCKQYIRETILNLK